ncbi:alpha-1,2-fucosyltransferase [Acidimicrobiaceae bacterium]|nr:alpha-1,2-fucosyltransferase [Acidimicrobiaceae bacterium]
MISFDYLASPGQLGNQMFKFAALKGIANKKKTEFLMPPSKRFLRNKQLFRVLNKLKIVDKRNQQNHFLFDFFEMSSVNNKNIGYSNSTSIIEEKSFNFDKNIFTTKYKSFDIYGFFQSYKYFDHIKAEILRDFTFKKKIRNRSLSIFSSLVDPISIHIRRGDYLTNPNHNPLSLSYYENCIEMLGVKNQYIIFSDDPLWAREQKVFKSKNFLFSDTFTSGKQALDLCLMTLCEKQIIANSTFSWWGAYLSSQKVVLTPKEWFKNTNYSDRDTSDLYPNNWKQVEN